MSSTKWLPIVALITVLASGCGQSDSPRNAAVGELKTTVDPITDSELQRFLRLVSRLPDGEVPEFTPTNQSQLDTLLPAKVLVSEFRSRYRQLCDPVQQGAVWDANLDLSRATNQEGWTSAQLAAFIRSLSCAVMKTQLTEKHDLKAIEQQCRHEITTLVKTLDEEERRPRSTMTEAFMQDREIKVRRLGRMVALLEFTLQLKPIPNSNLEIVRKYSSQIATLLPETQTQDPFQDPFGEEESLHDGQIIPAGYTAPRR